MSDLKKTLTVGELETLARRIRFRAVRNAYLTGTPHLGSCLSCIDLLVFFYWQAMRIDPANPSLTSRDRFLLSKGHAAPGLFQVLAERGYYPVENLETYGQDGSIFGEHPPAPRYLPGIEAATGSLGHGLPLATGMALASRIQRVPYDVYVVMGDGECNEGSVWEAAMAASAYGLENLTVAIDYNKWQATGRSQDILKLDPLSDKWRAFGWQVREVDGHDFQSIAEACRDMREPGKPKLMVAHTTKGKGVSFMEDDNNWHYRIPSADEVKKAAAELGIDDSEINIEGRTSISHGA